MFLEFFKKYWWIFLILIVVIVLIIFIAARPSKKEERQQAREEKLQYQRVHGGVGFTDESSVNAKDVRGVRRTSKNIAKAMCPYPRLSRAYRQCKRSVSSQLATQELQNRGTIN